MIIGDVRWKTRSPGQRDLVTGSGRVLGLVIKNGQRINVWGAYLPGYIRIGEGRMTEAQALVVNAVFPEPELAVASEVPL